MSREKVTFFTMVSLVSKLLFNPAQLVDDMEEMAAGRRLEPNQEEGTADADDGDPSVTHADRAVAPVPARAPFLHHESPVALLHQGGCLQSLSED